MLPLSAFENDGLRSLLNFLEPSYQPPSYKTVMNHILAIYNGRVSDLKRQLDCLNAKSVSITTDFWSNSQKKPFMTVTAHYIDVSSKNCF